MDVHLVDGTYELFRHYYALPSARDEDGREVAAVRGVLASVLGMIKAGATYLAVATDHVPGELLQGSLPISALRKWAESHFRDAPGGSEMIGAAKRAATKNANTG